MMGMFEIHKKMNVIYQKNRDMKWALNDYDNKSGLFNGTKMSYYGFERWWEPAYHTLNFV